MLFGSALDHFKLGFELLSSYKFQRFKWSTAPQRIKKGIQEEPPVTVRDIDLWKTWLNPV